MDMDVSELRSMYLHDLAKAPAIRSAIRRAAKRPDRTLVLPFRRFDDNPFLLYATCGLAHQDGVTIVLPPDPQEQ